MKVLLVSGSSGEKSTTRIVLADLQGRLEKLGCSVDFWDLASDPIGLFDVDTVYTSDDYRRVTSRAGEADVIIYGTPDYHGTISSTLKNIMDYLWTEVSGKLIGSVVGSYEKGLTVTDHIRTVTRQCYAWSLPYGVSFQEKSEVTFEKGVISENLSGRLDMMAHDILHYGTPLRDLRQESLTSDKPGFMAKYRK